MAWTFSGSGQYTKANTGAQVSAYPITIFARGKSTDTAALQTLFSYIQNSSPYNGMGLYFRGDVGGNPLTYSKWSALAVNSSGGYSSGVWVAATGRANSATQFDIDLDGTVTTGGTSSVAFLTSPPPADVHIGYRANPTATDLLTGSLACIALWAAYLDDAEKDSLVKGFSPRRVRPQSLKFYVPLVRDLRAVFDALASGGHSAWTTTGSPTVTDHPRSYGI